MRIGASLFLIAAGAVLRFAITKHYSHGVNLWAVGDILMIVGVVGLILTAIFMMTRRRTDVIHEGTYAPVAGPVVGAPRTRTTYVAPNDPMNAPY